MHQYTINSGAISLVATVGKTAIQIEMPATRRGKLKRIVVSGASVTATDLPMTVQIARNSTAGTGTSATPQPVEDGDVAALSGAHVNFTAEPTQTSVLEGPFGLTPVGGLLIYTWPYGDEPGIPASGRLGIFLTSPQAESNVTVTATIQE